MKRAIKTFLFLALILISAIRGFSQSDNTISYLRGISGLWEAISKDTSFISQLEYCSDRQKYFVDVTNTLLSKERKPFSYYEGKYFFNPSTLNIEFNTINKNEIHSGYCKVSGDTLFHYATLSGKSKIKSYASAIVKKDTSTLLYFASYSQSDELPELKFENPLIYKRHKKNNQEMKRVTGIGGVFFKSQDPIKLKEWYKIHLGLDTDEYGTNFEWRQSADPSKQGFTQWSPFTDRTKYFEPSTKDFMINYRVENLEALVEELRKEGVIIVDQIEVFEYGKFVHILDLEGNKIELWEPNDVEYNNIVKGRTK